MAFVILQIRKKNTIIKPWKGLMVGNNLCMNYVFNSYVNGILDKVEPVANLNTDGVIQTYVGRKRGEVDVLVDSTVEIGQAVSSLGNFVEFVIADHVPKQSDTDKTDAFALMMKAATVLTELPAMKDKVHTKKEQLSNDLIRWLQKNKLGWSKQSVGDLGEQFVNYMRDSLWYIDGNHDTLKARGWPVPEALQHFNGYNRPDLHCKKRITADKLSAVELDEYSSLLYTLTSQTYMKSDQWKFVFEAVLQLATIMRKHSEYLHKKNKQMKLHHEHTSQSIADRESIRALNQTINQKPSHKARYATLNEALLKAKPYEPLFVNDFAPTDPAWRKFTYINEMSVQCKAILFTYSGKESMSFIWKIPIDADENEILIKNNNIKSSIEKTLPVYHTRAMRRLFVASFGRVTSCKPMFLREAYKRLTGDRSSAASLSEAEVDRRVQDVLNMEDPDLICDLRVDNNGRPEEFTRFLEACQQYIIAHTEQAVDDRRHDKITSDDDIVTHLAMAMNTSHLYDEVCKSVPDDCPIPSIHWFRLQFWPRKCSTFASSRYKGTLKIRFMVQARQLRHDHEDAHYASALFRYQREFAVKFNDYCTFVCSDDKHTIKVGEPGYPVAAVDRGKEVIVGIGNKFQVCDHDFTKMTLIPSVHFHVAVPDDIDKGFYQGQVYVGVKNSPFEPSSALRHATELVDAFKRFDEVFKPVLLLYTDGGPDHRPTFMTVQQALVSLFLTQDLDYLCAVRTPPGHSWKNPAERIMSFLNVGLQSVGVMRSEGSETFEAILKKCNNICDIRGHGASDPDVVTELKSSLTEPVTLIGKAFSNLKLKEKPFRVFNPCRKQSMADFWRTVQTIDPSLQPTDTTTKQVDKKEKFNAFLQTHCRKRHYMFSIKKCGLATCAVCKPPKLPAKEFDSLKHMPDPMPEGERYKPFDDVYGSVTTEKHRPSQHKQNKGTGHGMPFSPTAQTAKNTKLVALCDDCGKWRLIYSKKTLAVGDRQKVVNVLADMSYTCGSSFQDLLGEDLVTMEHMYVRQNLRCVDPMEKPYYSANYDDVCYFCGFDDVMDGVDKKHYPICQRCRESKTPEPKTSQKTFNQRGTV